jgi:hypothetical protein
MPQNDDDLTRLADKRRRPFACFSPLYGAAACVAVESEDIATDMPHSAKINRDLTWGALGDITIRWKGHALQCDSRSSAGRRALDGVSSKD